MKQQQSQQPPKKDSAFSALVWGFLIVILLNWLVFPLFTGQRILPTDYGSFVQKIDS